MPSLLKIPFLFLIFWALFMQAVRLVRRPAGAHGDAGAGRRSRQRAGGGRLPSRPRNPDQKGYASTPLAASPLLIVTCSVGRRALCLAASAHVLTPPPHCCYGYRSGEWRRRPWQGVPQLAHQGRGQVRRACGGRRHQVSAAGQAYVLQLARGLWQSLVQAPRVHMCVAEPE